MAHHGAIYDPLRWSKKAVFKCTQSSTDAPAIAYTLESDLSGTPVWAYTSAGIYTLTLTGEWTANKTVVEVISNNATARICNVVYTSADVITFNWYDAATPTVAESGAFDLKITIYS